MRTALATALFTLALASAAQADRIVTLAAPHSAGPARYDRVRVLEQGSPGAKHVLVLVPGTSGGAAYLRLAGAEIVRRLSGWQVWSVERRENLLEDHSVLDRVLRGQAPPSALFPYYLGWIGAKNPGRHFVPKADTETAYARKWGMSTAIGDLHAVVAAARRGGRRVVLGGHSLGGTITTAYATWDFRGKAGARDLSGLVFIDGGSSSGGAITPAEARTQLAALDRSSPFLDLTGLGLPWSAGVFNAVGSTLALREPDAPSTLQAWPLLPANLKPPVRATNKAGYGYALDTETGPKSLALVQVHVGHLAASGSPRGWVDGELGSVSRVASVFSGIPGMDGTAWYHPKRLSLDGRAVNGGVANPAQKLLGVRATHGRDVHVPIYAFETSLGKGRVLAGARALARRSHVPARAVTLVDRSRTYAHIDPLAAAPRTNAFLRTVVPFLARIR